MKHVATLDLGSTKFCCMVVEKTAQGPKVLGTAFQKSAGLKAGKIIDLAAFEEALLRTIHEAETASQRNIESVQVNLSGALLITQRATCSLLLKGQEVEHQHLERLWHAIPTQATPLPNDGLLELIHVCPLGYKLDGDLSVRDPLGLQADTLEADLLKVFAPRKPLQALRVLFKRCHLDVETFGTSPYLSAVACLTPQEWDEGVLLLDLGGGTTTLSAYKHQAMHWFETVPLGGQHLSQDLAHALKIDLDQAERIKRLHASALPHAEVAATGGDLHFDIEGLDRKTQSVPASLLVSVIQPRLEEILELMFERLHAKNLDLHAYEKLVLVGGTAQLPRIQDLMRILLEKSIRLGKPTGVKDVAELHQGPDFAVNFGLALCAIGSGTLANPLSKPASTVAQEIGTGYFARLSVWFKTYF